MTASPLTTIDTAIWPNSVNFVLPGLSTRTIHSFLNNVVKPSLATMDSEVEKLRSSPEMAVRAFAAPQMEAMKGKTIQGFLLATHSMWERQLRTCLATIAQGQQRPDSYLDKRVHKATWGDQLNSTFAEVMGFPMSIFESYPHLDLAQLLANACRHGEGPSARDLHKRWPELWPASVSPLPLASPATTPASPTFEQARITDELPTWMATAICWFWDDLEYIRCNGFKSPNHAARDPQVQLYLDGLVSARGKRKLEVPGKESCRRVPD